MQALPSGRARGVLTGIFTVSPFSAPQLQTRPARSWACRPQALGQAVAPRWQGAPKHLLPPSGPALSSSSGSAALGRPPTWCPEAGRPAGAWESLALHFPAAAGIGVQGPEKPCAREPLGAVHRKGSAREEAKSSRLSPPQSGGLCSPALDSP